MIDDLFECSPEVVRWLCEGKALGTAKPKDLTIQKNVADLDDYYDDDELEAERKRGLDAGKKKLNRVQDRVKERLGVLTTAYETGDITAGELQKRVEAEMKKAWREVFAAGVRASGRPGTVDAPFAGFDDDDEKWLKSAIAHEMRFLNKFIEAVTAETYKMPLPRRIKMYADALSSFYDSARVLALPDEAILHWTGPKDKVTCASCAYLFQHSPYVKWNLPTTPRAGMTLCLCLTDCRVDIASWRGTIQLRDVKVGDWVKDHRGDWTEVMAVNVNRSRPEHRYAVVVGEHGQLFGVTDDHLVYTNLGWLTARQAAAANVRVRRAVGTTQQDGFVPVLHRVSAVEGQARAGEAGSRQRGSQASPDAVCGPDVAELQEDGQRAVYGEVLEGRAEAVCLPLSVGVGASEWAYSQGGGDSSQGRGRGQRHAGQSGVGRVAGQARQEARGPGVQADVPGSSGVDERQLVWGTELRSEVPRVQVRDQDESVAARVRAKTILLEAVPTHRPDEAGGPEVPEVPQVDEGEGVRGETEGRPLLLSELLQRGEGSRDEDPAVCLLRQEVHEAGIGDREVRVGQVLLLAGVLPEDSPLYDLTTTSGSFSAAGRAIHNTNCRDKLRIVRATKQMADDVLKRAKYTRGGHIRNLRRIKRLGHL